MGFSLIFSGVVDNFRLVLGFLLDVLGVLVFIFVGSSRWLGGIWVGLGILFFCFGRVFVWVSRLDFIFEVLMGGSYFIVFFGRFIFWFFIGK